MVVFEYNEEKKIISRGRKNERVRKKEREREGERKRETEIRIHRLHTHT